MQLTFPKSILRFALLIQLLFLARPCFAKEVELSSDMSIGELEFEIADDPRVVNEWARRMLMNLDRLKAPDQWVRVLAAIIISSNQMGEDRNTLVSQYKKEIESAVSLSKQIRLWQEYDLFQSLANQIRFGNDYDTYVVEDLKLLSFLFKNAPVDVALIRLSQIATSLSERERNAAARKYANQAKLILKENPQISDFRRQSINIAIALTLMEDPESQKAAQELFEEATKNFRKLARRHYLALTSFSYASHIVYERSPAKSPMELERAIGHLELAIAAAQLINDPILIGQSKAVIAHALNKLRKYSDAEKMALDALAVMKDNNEVATISASIAAAAAQIQLKKYAEAKDNLTNAEDLSDKSKSTPLPLRVDLKKLLSELSFANKNFDKAFRYQIEYYYLDNELNRRGKSPSSSRSKSDTNSQADEDHLTGRSKSDGPQLYGLWMALASLLFAIGGVALLIQKNKKIRKLETEFETQTLQRSFHPKLVEEVMLGRSQLDETVQTKLVTVLFADLVDFSSIAGKIGAERVTRLLNSYYKVMSRIVFEHEGMLDKFTGNGVMVIFGVPHTMAGKEQAIRSIHCAVEMMQGLTALNKKWNKELGTQISMRIGMCQGETIIGSFGTEQRSEYTAIGSTVHLAAKLQQHAQPGKISLSASLAKFFQEDCDAAPELLLPNSNQSIPVFEYPWRAESEADEDSIQSAV